MTQGHRMGFGADWREQHSGRVRRWFSATTHLSPGTSPTPIRAGKGQAVACGRFLGAGPSRGLAREDLLRTARLFCLLLLRFGKPLELAPPGTPRQARRCCTGLRRVQSTGPLHSGLLCAGCALRAALSRDIWEPGSTPEPGHEGLPEAQEAGTCGALTPLATRLALPHPDQHPVPLALNRPCLPPSARERGWFSPAGRW